LIVAGFVHVSWVNQWEGEFLGDPQDVHDYVGHAESTDWRQARSGRGALGEWVTRQGTRWRRCVDAFVKRPVRDAQIQRGFGPVLGSPPRHAQPSPAQPSPAQPSPGSSIRMASAAGRCRSMREAGPEAQLDAGSGGSSGVGGGSRGQQREACMAAGGARALPLAADQRRRQDVPRGARLRTSIMSSEQRA
jgi:hypothetical protein